MTGALVDLSDVQGIVAFAYKRLPEARLLFVRLDGRPEEARAWLRGLLPHVTPAAAGTRRREVCQVAFTASGLTRLGLGRRGVASLPREVQQGMASPERARILRDTGVNAPERWELGGPKNPRVDALLLLYAAGGEGQAAGEAGEEMSARYRAGLAATGTGSVVHEDAARLDPDGREHFGFHDGISQPVVQGMGRRAPGLGPEHEVAPGEVVLGYPNEYGLLPSGPVAYAPPSAREPRGGAPILDLGRGGSFLVVRKLAQDVAAFWSYVHEHGQPRPGEGRDVAAARLAARMVGRWPGGAPVSLSPDGDSVALSNANGFGFRRDDPDGHRCPFGAHIRRAMPRDMLEPSPEESWTASKRHRILRRGRIYGPRLDGHQPRRDDGAARGLYFLGLCGNVRRQFEFIQQTWMTNPTFAGLRDEMDPLLGHDPASARFTLPGAPVRRCVVGVPAFVRLRGGGYFFLPGLSALRFLAGASA